MRWRRASPCKHCYGCISIAVACLWLLLDCMDLSGWMVAISLHRSYQEFFPMVAGGLHGPTRMGFLWVPATCMGSVLWDAEPLPCLKVSIPGLCRGSEQPRSVPMTLWGSPWFCKEFVGRWPLLFGGGFSGLVFSKPTWMSCLWPCVFPDQFSFRR